jgi:hypothetical protein
MKRLIAHAAMAAACLVGNINANAVGLDGTQVSVGVYTTFFGPLTKASNTATAMVGSSVEFPVGSLTSIVTSNVIPLSIDVSADKIDFHYPNGANATATSFNGYIFDFPVLGLPGITGVSVDPLSTLSPVGFSFTSNSISVNVEGLSIPANTDIILDITASVPEPSAFALMLVGLGAAGAAVRRRRRRA